jgi:hypothetical protein
MGTVLMTWSVRASRPMSNLLRGKTRERRIRLGRGSTLLFPPDVIALIKWC